MKRRTSETTKDITSPPKEAQEEGATNYDDGDSNPLPSKIVIAAGTYDGVLAGWEFRTDHKNRRKVEEDGKNKLEILFATAVHGGSVRSLCMAAPAKAPVAQRNNSNEKSPQKHNQQPGQLLSCGYDETLRIHDFSKQVTCVGEVRTPADFGTPCCSSFAPPPTLVQASKSAIRRRKRPNAHVNNNNKTAPPTESSTHCLLGFSGTSGGKLVIYKKRDWSVQHVLPGHSGGVSAVAVHPTGKMALSGGEADGKLMLWDLTTGRLGFVTKIKPRGSISMQNDNGENTKKQFYDPIVDIVWSQPFDDCDDSDDGNTSGSDINVFAFCYGSHITVRDVGTGKDLLDVELPARVNQICLLQGSDDEIHGNQIFVAAACNDGSLPVLAVPRVDEELKSGEIKAMMAIEPVTDKDGRAMASSEERFKCITSAGGYYAVTANSAGVVSLMNLEGAINMINSGGNDDDDIGSNEGETPVHPESDEDSEGNSDIELAVDIVDSVQLGSGARITCLTAWSTYYDEEQDNESSKQEELVSLSEEAVPHNEDDNKTKFLSRKRPAEDSVPTGMDPEALQKARELVSAAKKIQKRKEKRKKRKKTKS